MSQYNKSEIERTARNLGFSRDTFEKVLRLKRIILFFNSEELLKSHFLLKGGTAINLTIFNMPRLSVDIDMDFIPNIDKKEMTDLRGKMNKIIMDYMSSEGYILSASSYSRHSLDSFHFNYVNSGGGNDLIKLEMNYSLRAHLFEPEQRVLSGDLFSENPLVLCVTPMEIFAAKTIALLTRAAARDLYDFSNLINKDLFQKERDLFRKSIIFYASISSDEVSEEFNSDSIDRITGQMIRRDLLPVLKLSERTGQFDLSAKISTSKEYIRDLMTLTDREKSYLRSFRTGEYKPELLFSDESIIERIKNHPMALWKCTYRKL